eukprot:m51a1_g8868 hypothetical protein (391) ;mRNA; f:588230-589627
MENLPPNRQPPEDPEDPAEGSGTDQEKGQGQGQDKGQGKDRQKQQQKKKKAKAQRHRRGTQGQPLVQLRGGLQTKKALRRALAPDTAAIDATVKEMAAAPPSVAAAIKSLPSSVRAAVDHLVANPPGDLDTWTGTLQQIVRASVVTIAVPGAAPAAVLQPALIAPLLVPAIAPLAMMVGGLFAPGGPGHAAIAGQWLPGGPGHAAVAAQIAAQWLPGGPGHTAIAGQWLPGGPGHTAIAAQWLPGGPGHTAIAAQWLPGGPGYMALDGQWQPPNGMAYVALANERLRRHNSTGLGQQLQPLLKQNAGLLAVGPLVPVGAVFVPAAAPAAVGAVPPLITAGGVFPDNVALAHAMTDAQVLALIEWYNDAMNIVAADNLTTRRAKVLLFIAS